MWFRVRLGVGLVSALVSRLGRRRVVRVSSLEERKSRKGCSAHQVDDYGWKRSTDGWIPVVGLLFTGFLGDLPVGECESWILARKERADGGARRWAGQARNLMEQD
jgi:hypothetical protein